MKPDFRFIETNGIALRAAVMGDGPLIVMVHGFPESWYSWRHQMAPLAAAGFTACAIDVRGYGGSDRPHAIEAYDIVQMTADVAGVVDAFSPGRPAVLMGHDWGASIVWNTALLHPDKVRAVAGLSVPYTPPGEWPYLEISRRVFTERDRFFYQIYFQEEGVAEAELEADPRTFLRKVFYAWSGDGVFDQDKPAASPLLDTLVDPDPFPSWLSAADIDYYVAEFGRTGLRGPLNRYRNNTRDWEIMHPYAKHKIIQPALLIVGERDPTLTMFNLDLIGRMRPAMADLRAVYTIPGVGHWTQQEAPDIVTGHLIDWLATLE
jgi:pimeloyl-ACP methyl ester carboxylesterase